MLRSINSLLEIYNTQEQIKESKKPNSKESFSPMFPTFLKACRNFGKECDLLTQKYKFFKGGQVEPAKDEYDPWLHSQSVFPPSYVKGVSFLFKDWPFPICVLLLHLFYLLKEFIPTSSIFY